MSAGCHRPQSGVYLYAYTCVGERRGCACGLMQTGIELYQPSRLVLARVSKVTLTLECFLMSS